MHTKTKNRLILVLLILSCILIFALCISFVFAQTSNANLTTFSIEYQPTANVSAFSFAKNSAGTEYSITSLKNSISGDCIIPNTYNGLPVTTINRSAFSSSKCQNVTSLKIQENLVSIDSAAFSNAKNLVKIEVSEDNPVYKSDGNCIIEKATNTLVKGCKTSIIPEYVETIGEYAFSQCGMDTFAIPESVHTIEQYAFNLSSNLTEIIIPESVSSIGENPFMKCANLTNIVVDGNNSNYTSRNLAGTESNCIIEIATNTLVSGCKTTTIPEDESVKIIGVSAFNGVGLTGSINLPDNIEEIGIYSFLGNQLETITLSNNLKTIGGGAFEGNIELTEITISASVTSIGTGVFSQCDQLKLITVESGNAKYKVTNKCLIETDTNTVIGGYVTDSSTSITIPTSATSIAESSFLGYTRITSVTINSGVQTIGDEAFYGCTGITSLSLGSNLKTIGYSAFRECSGIKSVSIPANVTLIDTYAFCDCLGITSLTFSSSGKLEKIEQDAFANCVGIKTVTIPNSVTHIMDRAFYSCENLKSVTIGSKVEYIGSYAFAYCATTGTASFKNQTGWKIYEESIDVSVAGTAWVYLTDTYKTDSWFRYEN